MVAWIDAFLPTFGLIAIGLALRSRWLRDDAVWAGLERLIFWVLLPPLFVSSISAVDLRSLPLGGMAASIWAALLLGTGSAIGLARALGHDHAAMTSVVQGGIRFNTFVAFSILGGLFGPKGIALAGIVSGLIVPFGQLLLTLVFASGGAGRFDPLGLARQLATNPLLLGCVAGFAFAVAGGMPPGLGPLARALGQSSVALGLLCVGAALSPAALREHPLTQVLVGAQKLVLIPLLTYAGTRLFGLEPLAAAASVLVMAVPTATTSYVMARAMGGDARLMAATITLQHLAGVVTLPLWALVLDPPS